LSTRGNFSTAIGPGLIILAALLGCKRGGVHKVGETAEQSDYRLTILQVKDCELSEADRGVLIRAKDGAKALGVEAILEPTGDRDLLYAPYRAVVTDSTGATYPGAVMVLCQPEILPKAEKLQKNGKYRGFITFHLPPAASGLKLRYQPFAIKEQPVEFDLGR